MKNLMMKLHLTMKEVRNNKIIINFMISFHIQSTDKVDKDNDPSSDTDVETQTNHSISIGGI